MDKNLPIGAYIKQFMNERAGTLNPTFYLNELHSFVQTNSDKLPTSSSIDRILRRLRTQGEIDYVVINHATSYYQAKPIKNIALPKEYSYENEMLEEKVRKQ